METKEVQVYDTKTIKLYLGAKGVWYMNERQAKDSHLPQPVDKLIAMIVA